MIVKSKNLRDLCSICIEIYLPLYRKQNGVSTKSPTFNLTSNHSSIRRERGIIIYESLKEMTIAH